MRSPVQASGSKIAFGNIKAQTLISTNDHQEVNTHLRKGEMADKVGKMLVSLQQMANELMQVKNENYICKSDHVLQVDVLIRRLKEQDE